MKIGTFTSDREKVEAWLAATASFINGQDQFASFWFHPDSNGFGVVFLDFTVGNSGEFHLFQDGKISEHIEHEMKVVADCQHRVAHFYEFEERFENFKAKVSECKQK